MSEPFLGEIRRFAFNFAPRGWAACDGQSLPVNQNQVLYSLIGNAFGGDNRNFRLPDLRGCTALQQGPGLGSLGARATNVTGQPLPFLTILFAIALQGRYPEQSPR